MFIHDLSRTKGIALVLGFFFAVLPLGPTSAAALDGVIHVQAAQNCYFGGNVDQNQAQQGIFSLVYVAKGATYNWQLGHNVTKLYWGAVVANGGPMPTRIPLRGTVLAGATIRVP